MKDTWQEIIESVGTPGLNSVNVGTAKRRAAVLAVDSELSRLRAQIDAADRIFAHFGGLGELAKWENANGESAAQVVKEYQEAS